MHASGAPDKCNELPTNPHYDQPLANQIDVFQVPPQTTTPFQQVSQRKSPTHCLKDNPGGNWISSRTGK